MVATFALVFAASALSSAFALTIGDSRDLGLLSPNHPANPSSSAGFIDILLNQPLNSGPTSIGANIYTRTGNDPLGGDYPKAILLRRRVRTKRHQYQPRKRIPISLGQI